MLACDKCRGNHSYAFVPKRGVNQSRGRDGGLAITKNESSFSFLLTLLCFPLLDTDSDSTRRTEEDDLTGII